jgi:hypothetical protein
MTLRDLFTMKYPNMFLPKKLIIIGDSHARGLSSTLKGSLTDDFQVIGYVKPGAAIETLISSTKRDIANLNKNDVIVFCGGARDISNNNTQNGLRYLINFVKETKHTNIILISVPHRHDLVYWSCVNKEVETFNRKLIKLIKPLEHVMMAKPESNRNYFTSHGMHLNNKGKEQVVIEVSKVNTSMFLEQIENPTVLPLKMVHEEGISLNSYVKGGITLCETTSTETTSNELQVTNGHHINSTSDEKHTDLETSSTKHVRTYKRQKRHLTSNKNNNFL